MTDSCCDLTLVDSMQSERSTDKQAPYLAAYAEWLRTGRPEGKRPDSLAFGLNLCDATLALCYVEGAFREKHGLGSWNFYRPEYYDEMNAHRRKAVAEGLDPDRVALEFTKLYYPDVKAAA